MHWKNERILVVCSRVTYQIKKWKLGKLITWCFSTLKGFADYYTQLFRCHFQKSYLSSFFLKILRWSLVFWKMYLLLGWNYDLSQKHLLEFDCLTKFPICRVLSLLLRNFTYIKIKSIVMTWFDYLKKLFFAEWISHM